MPRIAPRAPNEDELEAIPAAELEDEAVEDVPARFEEISTEPLRFVTFCTDSDLKSVRYTKGRRNNRGAQNHFQGFQRLRQSPFLVVAGGNWRKRGSASHLFIVKMGSRSGSGVWLSNIALPSGNSPYDQEPPAEDAVVGFVAIDRFLWHVGGLDTCGHVLAVPIECGAKGGVVRPPKCQSLDGIERQATSRIEFLYMEQPTEPIHLPCTIERHDTKATAVGLVRLSSGGRYVAAVLRAVEGGKRLEFYLSRSANIWKGWGSPSHLDIPKGDFGGYQTINLIRPSSQADRLYLVGLENTSPAAPTLPGDDRADLYEISLTAPGIDDEQVTVTAIERKLPLELGSNGEWANMAAGAGIYVDQGRLIIYSTYHYRDKGKLGFLQYAP